MQFLRGAEVMRAEHTYLPSHPAGSWVGKGMNSTD